MTQPRKKPDPLVPAPKKAHAKHGLGKWGSAWPYNFDNRACLHKNCRCMRWCCYQQRRSRA